MNKLFRKLAALFLLAALIAPAATSGILQAQEKELVVYSTIFAEYADKMKAEFEKLNPGVKVYIINPGGTEAMIKKLEAEKANPQADVMHSGDSSNYLYAKKQGLLQPYAPTAPGFKPSIDIGGKKLALSDKDNYYHVFKEYASSMVKNLLLPDPTLEEKARPEIQAKFGEYSRLK